MGNLRNLCNLWISAVRCPIRTSIRRFRRFYRFFSGLFLRNLCNLWISDAQFPSQQFEVAEVAVRRRAAEDELGVRLGRKQEHGVSLDLGAFGDDDEVAGQQRRGRLVGLARLFPGRDRHGLNVGHRTLEQRVEPAQGRNAVPEELDPGWRLGSFREHVCDSAARGVLARFGH